MHDARWPACGRKTNRVPALKGELMKHQPFEEWLLDDLMISPEQKRELDSHLRTCAYCSALAETGIALRSVKMGATAAKAQL